MFAYCNNNPVMYTDPSGNSISLGLLVLIGAAICMIASANVKNTYKKFANQRSMTNMTGAQVAEKHCGFVVNKGDIYNVIPKCYRTY